MKKILFPLLAVIGLALVAGPAWACDTKEDTPTTTTPPTTPPTTTTVVPTTTVCSDNLTQSSHPCPHPTPTVPPDTSKTDTAGTFQWDCASNTAWINWTNGGTKQDNLSVGGTLTSVPALGQARTDLVRSGAVFLLGPITSLTNNTTIHLPGVVSDATGAVSVDCPGVIDTAVEFRQVQAPPATELAFTGAAHTVKMIVLAAGFLLVGFGFVMAGRFHRV